MIIKTCELKDEALDWAACYAVHGTDSREVWAQPSGSPYPVKGGYRPSMVWGHGGPLVEGRIFKLEHTGTHTWIAWLNDMKSAEWRFSSGSTPLIAAMRAIVAAELGEEVDVPDEIAKSGG